MQTQSRRGRSNSGRAVNIEGGIGSGHVGSVSSSGSVARVKTGEDHFFDVASYVFQAMSERTSP